MGKILYIDDDALMTEVMLEGLRQVGRHEVSYEKKADDAAVAIRSEKQFDLIILDIMMRKGTLEPAHGETQTGYILYRMIRESRPKVPIIVLSVLKEDQAPSSVRDDTRHLWIRKPIDLMELIARIGEELGK